MRSYREAALRSMIWGTATGAIVLGVGGRLAMAAIQVQQGGVSRWTLGGSLTVVLLGAASGFAGGVILFGSELATRRLSPAARGLRYLLFAVVLGLITMRGLRGAPAFAGSYFYPLVAAYGLALALTTRERSQPVSVPTALTPGE